MNKTKFIENIRKPGNKLKLTVSLIRHLAPKELIIDLEEIEDVETIISDNKSVVELIEESGDLQEALKYVSDPLSKEEFGFIGNYYEWKQPCSGALKEIMFWEICQTVSIKNETDYEFNGEEILAITQQMKELGWIK